MLPKQPVFCCFSVLCFVSDFDIRISDFPPVGGLEGCSEWQGTALEKRRAQALASSSLAPSASMII